METNKMRMKITEQFLENWNACVDGKIWVLKQGTDDAIILINRLLVHNPGWANWLVVRCLEPGKNQLRYAIYAAESVIEIFEEKYPNDNRPRLAIAAAKKVLKNNTQSNRASATSAVWTAGAGSSAWTAGAGSSAWAAASAASAAAWASNAAANAAAIAGRFRKIIKHGLRLLKKQEIGK